MPNNYCLFSAEITKLTDKELAWWHNEVVRVAALDSEAYDLAYENGEICQDFSVDDTKREVWFCAEESGNVEAVANVVQRFLKELQPHGCFGLEYAFTCSRPIIGEFGGGAIFVTATTNCWMNTGQWVARNADRFDSGRPLLGESPNA